MMADNKEKRLCFKVCFLLGKSAAETVLMLQEAFKEEVLSRNQVYEWCSRFKGDEGLVKLRGGVVGDNKKSVLLNLDSLCVTGQRG